MNKRKQPSLIGRIMRFSGQKKSLYAISVILAILGVACSILPYYFVARIVAKLLEGGHAFADYGLDLGLIAVFWTLQATFHGVSTSCSHAATFSVLANVRKAICKKLTRVPLGDVLAIPTGALKNTIVERVDSMETTLAHILPEFTANFTAPVGLFIFLCTVSWKLALASLATLPVGGVFMLLMTRNYAENWANCVEKTKILNDTAVEYINGIEVIKAFGKADSSYEKFKKAAYDGAHCFIDWMRSTIVAFNCGYAIAPATLLTVLPVSGVMYLHGSIDASTLVMALILSVGLIRPLMTIFSYGDDITKAGTIFDEVTKLLDMKEMERPEKSLALPSDAAIELNDVRFGYAEDKEILHGVNLKMKSGTVNALVGPSGSGKSTIARLIASLWDVNSGEVKIGGVNVKDLAVEDFNKYVAYVSQDNYLFNRSVMENIRLGKKDATDEEIIAAAKKCACHDFIMSLEKGYDTIVGDAGSHLSGGEKQRISIARAMLKNAPIVILDEATAYTDPENEALIQRSLAEITRGKTLVVIAHRLSTITGADNIFVIKDGEVVGNGKHDELLNSCDTYKNMWAAHVMAKDGVEEEVK